MDENQLVKTMSAFIRLIVATVDTGSDVFNGLNFLKVHISFGGFIDNLLDKLGGSEADEEEDNRGADPIWGALAISLIFLPGIVYGFISIPYGSIWDALTHIFTTEKNTSDDVETNHE